MSTTLDPPLAKPRVSMRSITWNSEARIPGWVTDLATFRKWADSPEYPDRGKFCYLQGDLWVDLEMEELFSHNLLKTKLAAALDAWSDAGDRGYVFSDGVRLSNPSADLSSEPDTVFTSFENIKSGRVKLVRGSLGGYVELEGSPELVVEIVSRSSVQKDTVLLKRIYAEADIPEYWVIDARKPAVQFQLWVLTPDGYATAEMRDGQPMSPVLQSRVEIGQSQDPLGHPRFTVKFGG